MAYSLSTHYAGLGLLDSFSFFTGEDPNYGFVDYQSREKALASNLVSVDEHNRVKLGVDSVNTYLASDKGRPSVRITSKDDFTHGLFIADFAHMPSSTCGTWPSFWAFNNVGDDSSWPTGGEINIVEGANTAQRNLFSAHTTGGCHAQRTGFAGAQGPTDCSLRSDNIGCNYASPISDSTTYGDAFNAEGGGVYALEWDSQDVKIWHFPRTAIPDDINLAPMTTPDPSAWGPPHALFGGSNCEADSHFFNMSLVINTNFCGEYAGKNWGVGNQCDKLGPTCEEYVAGNPTSFNNAFWQINYIDVYKKPVAGDGTLSYPVLTNTSASALMSPSIASPPVPRSTALMPTRTRTITVTTITQAISTARPTQTSGRLADPATIDGWMVLGCFRLLGGDKSFTRVSSSATMDTKACVANCTGHKYAGVSGRTCYCADLHDDAIAVPNDMCDAPCPGSPQEVCGGSLTASESTSPGLAGMGVVRPNSAILRNGTGPSTSASASASASIPSINPLLLPAAPPTMLLTVYGTIEDAMPPGAPGKGGRPPKDEHRAKEQGQGQGQGVTAVAVQTVVPLAHNASYATVGPSPCTAVPVVGAAGTAPVGGGTAGFLRTLGYGLALWLVVFAIGMVL